MIDCNGHPFLFYLLEQLKEQGISRFLLLTGYLSNKQYAPETLRQLYQILRFGGVLGDTGPRSYSAEENMQIDDKKQNSLVLPEPTNRKHDVIPGKNNLGNYDLKNPQFLVRML